MDPGEDAAAMSGPVAKQPTRFVVEGVPKGLQGLLGADGIASEPACAICRPAPIRGTVEHRLFSFISRHWRGKTLHSLVIGINLTGSSTTGIGMKVCELDEYPTGIKRRLE